MTKQEEDALTEKFRGPKMIAWVLLIGSLAFLLSSLYPIFANEFGPHDLSYEYATVDTPDGTVEFFCLQRDSYPQSGPDCFLKNDIDFKD